ncbi:MAG: alpha/beta hydrolase [Microthrixaceae bacterium]|nr:alpha/beta hydrolase [Microthrixaceae bacterium]MCB1010518.1 alpha/beta hydrolase [Microthrixaceae bacterium]MCB9386355.1 alpha/beta hydrolase [Microthrixaceae bacterium]MCO5320922.1 alpha/beta fold hydrolase [Microthrixaceae bacterium]
MSTTQANGIEVFYETFGDPTDPTLLLVNGLGTQAIGQDQEYCEALAALGLHVIRYDNRDVGLSTHVDSDVGDVMESFATALGGGEVDAPYTLSDMAADGIGLLDSLDIGAAHILGSSMGGMIVQTMAIEHPGRVLSLTSVMSTTGEPEYGTPDPECLAGLATLMVPAGDRAQRIEAGVQLQKLIGTKGVWDEGWTRQRVAAAVDRAYDPDGVARQMTAILASGSRAEGLSELSLPTVVLHGDADPLVNISGGERTAELVPGAELRVMPGMGHDLPPAYWDRLVAAVADLSQKVAR